MRRTWAPEEVQYLEDNGHLTLAEMATHLDRPVKMVRWKLHTLELPFRDARQDGQGVPASIWTPERVEALRTRAAHESAADIANALGLAEKQIRQGLEYYKIAGRGVVRQQDPEHVEKRAAALRGVEKVDRTKLRECKDCGEMCLPYAFPSEKARSTRWTCAFCRAISRHGITGKRAKEMLAEQGNKCKICPNSFDDKRAVLDHDHQHCAGNFGCPECIRGFLCDRCNHIVGVLDEFALKPELETAARTHVGVA